MIQYIDKEIIGKTISEITEGYEPENGYRMWVNRIVFTDGTSALMTLEGDDDDTDPYIRMEKKP